MTSDTSATFTLNPGTATGSLVVTEAADATTHAYTINGVPGSLRLQNEWTIQNASNTLLSNQPTVSFSFFVKYNSVPTASTFLTDSSSYYAAYASTSGTSGTAHYSLWDSSGSAHAVAATVATGVVYHVAMTWSAPNNRWYFYVNGRVVGNGIASLNYGVSISRYQIVGSTLAGAADFQISNLAVWLGYELTATDVLNLRNATYNPGTLIGSSTATLEAATSWWPLGLATSGNAGLTPGSGADIGFTDLGSGGHSLTTVTGTTGNAVYAGPLAYTPAVVAPLVSKSGQTLFFMTQSGGTTRGRQRDGQYCQRIDSFDHDGQPDGMDRAPDPDRRRQLVRYVHDRQRLRDELGDHASLRRLIERGGGVGDAGVRESGDGRDGGPRVADRLREVRRLGLGAAANRIVGSALDAGIPAAPVRGVAAPVRVGRVGRRPEPRLRL